MQSNLKMNQIYLQNCHIKISYTAIVQKDFQKFSGNFPCYPNDLIGGKAIGSIVLVKMSRKKIFQQLFLLNFLTISE